MFIVFVIMLLNNFSNWKSYGELEANFSSIYKDRLMPSVYLFRLNDLLYEKRELQQENDIPAAQRVTLLDGYNRMIDSIIRSYETTYLTLAEKEQWKNFLGILKEYNKAEAAAVSPWHTGTPVSPDIAASLQAYFRQAKESLNGLNEIQTQEGNLLQRESKAIIGGSIIKFYLEIALLIILCIMALVLVNMSEKNIYHPSGRQVYN